MKNPFYIPAALWIAFVLAISCNKKEDWSDIPQSKVVEETTARGGNIMNNCSFPLSDTSMSPDLQLVTNAEEDTLYADGTTDSSSYFWIKYHVRTNPIKFVPNYLVSGYYAKEYGWDSGVLVNMFRLQCLIENIAAYGCKQAWKFIDTTIYEGLFEFESFELIGKRWKPLYTDYKKTMNPSLVPTREYLTATFCSYPGYKTIPAQTGDFYYQYFRLPPHDGTYKLIIKFNPLKDRCRAVEETRYDNDQKIVVLEIKEGRLIILSTS